MGCYDCNFVSMCSSDGFFRSKYKEKVNKMRKDTTDRLLRASKLHGKARKRANKAAKKADKATFKHELMEML